jgi:hypothetical protein
MDGLDGAWYGAAELTAAAGMSGGPAVGVTTSAGTLEVVTGFADAGARDDWMADRAPGRTGPLAISHTGPRCRAVLEERVLAWLLCNGGGSGEGWRPHAFTTYSRSEIFLAWRAAAGNARYRGSASTEAELRSRLLRAPAWAAPDIGWPYGQDAVAYLHRLAVTPVTLAQAQAAALELVRLDRPVRGPRRQPPAAAGDPGRTADLRARHGAGARAPPRRTGTAHRTARAGKMFSRRRRCSSGAAGEEKISARPDQAVRLRTGRAAHHDRTGKADAGRVYLRAACLRALAAFSRADNRRAAARSSGASSSGRSLPSGSISAANCRKIAERAASA